MTTSFVFANAQQTQIVATEDDLVRFVPVDDNNADYQRIKKLIADGLATIGAYVPPPPPPQPTLDEIYDQTIQNSRVLKALVLAINDGSLVPGSNRNAAQLRAIIKAKM